MNKSLPIVGKWWLSNNFRKRIPGKLYNDNNCMSSKHLRQKLQFAKRHF